MKITYVALGFAPALLLAACGGGETGSNAAADNVTAADVTGDGNFLDNAAAGNAMTTDAAISPGQKFANDVGASDWYEIEAGKLAQEKAQAQALKDFGKMMVEHHTMSTDKLKAAGAKADPAIVPNPALTAEQEANLAALRTAEGAAFDTAYKTQQVAAHEMALGIVKAYAASGDVAPLKAFAGEATKVVETHLAKIKSL